MSKPSESSLLSPKDRQVQEVNVTFPPTPISISSSSSRSTSPMGEIDEPEAVSLGASPVDEKFSEVDAESGRSNDIFNGDLSSIDTDEDEMEVPLFDETETGKLTNLRTLAPLRLPLAHLKRSAKRRSVLDPDLAERTARLRREKVIGGISGLWDPSEDLSDSLAEQIWENAIHHIRFLRK